MISDGITLGTVSGYLSNPRSFISTNGEITIRFTSDSSVTYQGYEAYFVIAGKSLEKTFYSLFMATFVAYLL